MSVSEIHVVNGPHLMTPMNAWRFVCRRLQVQMSRASFYRWLKVTNVGFKLGGRWHIPFEDIENEIKKAHNHSAAFNVLAARQEARWPYARRTHHPTAG